MKNIIKQPKWKEVEYSRSQIINAGKVIRKEDCTEEEKMHAVAVIDNWRAAHAFPLHVIYVHLRRMAEDDPKVIVAERLKRLESITSKLVREPAMNLWTMQDLGGCRVIVSNIKEVYSYCDKYEKSKKRHILKKINDYIAEPKASGYRSLHVVYEYQSDRSDKYNKNMLIEIQYRTHLQHLWATAVETMGLFTKKSIKSGQGSEHETRFFLLISALFAHMENHPLPPNVPCDINMILDEIQELNDEHSYLAFLNGIRVVVKNNKFLVHKDFSNGYYLLVLNYVKKRLTIKSFPAHQINLANQEYAKLEKKSSTENIDVVLVRVSTLSSLQSAYPNYFSDISEFVQIVAKAIM